jgi:hypothetical protein
MVFNKSIPNTDYEKYSWTSFFSSFSFFEVRKQNEKSPCAANTSPDPQIVKERVPEHEFRLRRGDYSPLLLKLVTQTSEPLLPGSVRHWPQRSVSYPPCFKHGQKRRIYYCKTYLFPIHPASIASIHRQTEEAVTVPIDDEVAAWNSSQ